MIIELMRYWARKLMRPREVKSMEVSPKEAHQMVQNGQGILVDIREKAELSSGIASGAQWIATSEIDRGSERWESFLASVPKNMSVLFYCAGGVRAGRIAEMVAAKGFKVGNVGGFIDWVAAGLPTIDPP